MLTDLKWKKRLHVHDEADDDGADAEGELADAHVDPPPEEVHQEYLDRAEFHQLGGMDGCIEIDFQ